MWFGTRASALIKLLVPATLLLAAVAHAQTAWTVTNFTDTSFGTLETGGGFGPGVGSGSSGDLRYVLFQAMATGGVNTITFSGCSTASPCTIVLGAPLPPIFEMSNISSFSLTIDGGTQGAVIIDGNSKGTNTTTGALTTNRVFFVDNVAVTLKNLVIQNATAQGGAGAGGGGGGAGFGAGLFVNQSTAAVVVQNTSFTNCSVIGGAGSDGYSGGGGGLSGAGATMSPGYGGGGGGGVSGAGSSTGSSAGGSAFGANTQGSSTVYSGPYLNAQGGNGGAGGGGAGAPNVQFSAANGGNGGFGGGGGGGVSNNGSSTSGNGGLGGGGGGGANAAGSSGGNGGFGGGGGGGNLNGTQGVGGGGVGGVNGGNGAFAGGAGFAGGGGAAAGPAIFVVNGSVTLYKTTGSGFTATGGAPQNGNAGTGTASAVPVFNYGGTVNGSKSVGPVYNAFTVTEPVGTTSATQTATLTFTTAVTSSNTFTTNVLTQGAANLDFKLISGGTCSSGTAYAVGSTCTVEYSFTPTSPGIRYGGITLVSSGSVVASTLISGVGTGPQVTFPSTTTTTTLGGNSLYPSNLAIDGAGKVYIGTQLNATQSVKVVPPACTSSNCVTSVGPGFPGSYGVALDGSGNLYVASPTANGGPNAGSINEVPPGCTSTSCLIALGGGFVVPEALALDGFGNVYVADDSSTHKGLYEIPAGCASSSCVITLGGGAVGQSSSIAVDGSGNTYLAYGGHIYLVPAGCTTSGCVTELNLVTGTADSVAVDGSGNVYAGVNGSSTGAVEEIPSGCISSSCVITLTGGFTQPVSVAVDGSGNVYVADAYFMSPGLDEIPLATPPTVAFATTTSDGTTDTTDGTKTVTVQNIGNATLSFAIPGSGVTNPTTPHDFTFASSTSGACPSLTSSASTQGTLAAGASCTVPITFTPVEPSNGALSESLIFTDNALNATSATQSITLTGVANDPAPIINTISPNHGPIAGGTAVTITGANFTGTQNVYFLQCAGNSTASFTVVNSTTITATSTADGLGSACTAQVSIATPGGTSNSVSFNYYNPVFTSLTVSGYGSPAILTEGSIVTVTAYDQNGNVDTSFTGTVTLSSSDAKATLPGSYAFQSSDNGVHTFNVTLNTLGPQSITATSGSVSASQTGILVGDAVWVLSSNGYLTKLNSQGASEVAQSQTASLGSLGALAMDNAGDVWFVSTGSGTLNVINNLDTQSSYRGFGSAQFNSPNALAIDGAGYVWITNSGGNTVSKYNNSGTGVTTSTGYGSSYVTGQAMNAPIAIAIDNTGGVWVANKSGNTVTHIFGAAQPVVTPLSTATANGTLGTKP